MAAWWKRQRKEQPAAAYLSDDILIEILVRLPAMALGRCKCVSRSWRDLISGPVHRHRLAHTDAASGFFYHCAPATDLNFTALCPPDEGVGSPSPSPSPAPSLDQAFPFLPSPSTGTEVKLLDSCNGLLLLRYRRHAYNYYHLAPPRYIVCNPSTDGWAMELPVPWPEDRDRRALRPAALTFDPAISSHFHVFELVEEKDNKRRHSSRYAAGCTVTAVRIYSSDTGE
ncbi:unnamed protein product [Urochloa humidicola]